MENVAPPTQSSELIDALNGTFGKHAGFRASHAKGTGVSGSFHPAKPEGGLHIPLLAKEQAVMGRFSIGGGKPGISDKSQTVRGLGLRIGQGAESWVLALISAPVFFANSAQQFKDFLEARKPNPELGGPDPARVKAFNEANPNTKPHQQYLAQTPPCSSYTKENYHSAHAYGFQENDHAIFARIKLVPEHGREGLSGEELAALPDNFLFDKLGSELAAGLVRWKVFAVVAGASDNITDPTEPWHEPNREIALGTLEISALITLSEADVFDPSVMPKGIEAPKDNVFDLRSAAYSVSKERRG